MSEEEIKQKDELSGCFVGVIIFFVAIWLLSIGPLLKIGRTPTPEDYSEVAKTLKDYYRNYFNVDNWYVNSVIPLDKGLYVSIVVSDPTWIENIKNYSSNKQYMINCACPNSLSDVWRKIEKSDVSVTIYDTRGKRIGGGFCTN